ncbi:ATP-binding protein [Intrasporangium sp. YIM S08009]|uniref:ATP-binding protein n=1 Tax=Intrasporangium zincisolvens TaxID=3080018 RepID=UPI002B05A0BE|nr:ATP-binding protein [Intrasporangium sp. YIM S08009]
MTTPTVDGDTELARLDFGPDDLRRVREVVRSITEDRVPDRVGDAEMAVHEVAVNSIVHGGGHGHLRIDAVDESLVFTVEDSDGTGSTPMVREAGHEALSGRGLWIAECLTDRLVIESTPERTTVRLHVDLPSRRPAR